MRHDLRGLTPLLVAISTVVCVGASPAAADVICQEIDPQTGQCKIHIETGSEPPSTSSDPSTEPASSGGSGRPTCYFDPAAQGEQGDARTVPCQDPSGSWSNVHGCYMALANPPPPAGDPAWAGHAQGDGAVYSCYQPWVDLRLFVWLAAPPPVSGTGPTPGEVAQLAVERMDLHAIKIGIVPKPGPDSVGLVGMPVWMWVADRDAHTFGPATATASAGGVTVTATARVERVTWAMGDGAEVVCTRAGTPYRAGFGMKDSPDCGYRYQRTSAGQPDDRYTVTARSDWVVDWQGAGQSGTIRLGDLESSVQIAIGEAQVLVN